jgi:AcrR family transcriptional regulator
MSRSRARKSKPYHHGDLAPALLAAAEQLIEDRGVEGFTLREAARRAGVSHAAPAHHFGDANGLLTELAAVGFDRLTAAQREAITGVTDPTQRVVEMGLSYVGFALDHPAQFRLMFSSGRIERTSDRLRTAGRAAFQIFLETFAAARGVVVEPLTPHEAGRDPVVLRQWAQVHGLATLAIEGQLGPTIGPGRKRLIESARAVLEAALKALPTRKESESRRAAL